MEPTRDSKLTSLTVNSSSSAYHGYLVTPTSSGCSPHLASTSRHCALSFWARQWPPVPGLLCWLISSLTYVQGLSPWTSCCFWSPSIDNPTHLDTNHSQFYIYSPDFYPKSRVVWYVQLPTQHQPWSSNRHFNLNMSPARLMIIFLHHQL